MGVMTSESNEDVLRGQVAIVTGGGRGIGREVARQLAGAGASVGVTARTVSQLEETRSLITSAGGSCTVMQMDVLDETVVNATFREIEESHGWIDLLVNNAGITGQPGLPWELDAAITDRTAAVAYLFSPRLTRNALPLEYVCEVAHERGVPVLVNAASFLPPRANAELGE